jgi:hypothetical protein
MPSRAAPAPARFAWALALALVLALRLVTPVGFMPSFERAQVSVVPCDGFATPPAHMGHHGDHHGKSAHEPCPYAAGASPALLPVGELARIEPLAATASAAVRLSATTIERLRNDRPPATGPPIPQF